jgi:hypothetical protein
MTFVIWGFVALLWTGTCVCIGWALRELMRDR